MNSYSVWPDGDQSRHINLLGARFHRHTRLLRAWGGRGGGRGPGEGRRGRSDAIVLLSSSWVLQFSFLADVSLSLCAHSMSTGAGGTVYGTCSELCRGVCIRFEVGRISISKINTRLSNIWDPHAENMLSTVCRLKNRLLGGKRFPYPYAVKKQKTKQKW